LRIEDLDTGRSRREYAEMLEDDLSWLGLEWDEGGLEGRGACGPYLQSERGEIYAEALQKLEAKGLVYPCHCTRADIMATQAPHESDGRIVYQGTCRPVRLGGASSRLAVGPSAGENALDALSTVAGRQAASRLYVPDETITFTDGHYGSQTVNLARHCGDFVVRRGDGAWAYQLAVVVDDALMGVTEVVRGRDLLLSSPQQIYMYRLLNYSEPEFIHLPLLCSEDGRRLCKRDKSLDMGELRKNYSAARIIGHLAYAANLIDREEAVSAGELLDIFDWRKIPSEDIICSRTLTR
ncbi:MAG: tRNA glutamyl-Q(34) synthetase GluQRS, partial [Bacteroidales bacterium]|nr:tRNA glutamyl-Q(34) synthetase GluQRS [Bacteroidales bacterium]